MNGLWRVAYWAPAHGSATLSRASELGWMHGCEPMSSMYPFHVLPAEAT